jgi:hypothetical protein
MGHTLHHQGLNLDEELLHSERERRGDGPFQGTHGSGHSDPAEPR